VQNIPTPIPSTRHRTRASEAATETAYALLDGLWTGPVALGVLDRNLRLVDVNDAMAETLQIAPREAAGRTLGDISRGWGPALRDEMDRVSDACRVVVDTGRPFLNLSAHGSAPDGAAREWLCSFFPIVAPSGAPRGVLAMLSDATDDREREAALARARDDAHRALEAEREAREAEARSAALLDAVVENAPLGIAFLDRDLRFRWLNRRLADMNGLAPARHLGRTPRELFPCLPAEAQEGFERVAGNVLATGEPVHDFELQAETAAAPGKVRTWLESWYPVRSGGEVLGLGALVREVTAEREADEFRRNVLGIVGHDLRTPLAALAGSAQLLVRSERLPPELARTAARVLSNVARMDRIISMLLDYARLQAGQGVPLDRRPCDLATIAETVVDELRAAHPGREVRVAGEGSPRGSWDPDRIAQVLSNLLSNALSHSPAASAVELRWRAEGEAICLDVWNEAPVIPPEVAARIFEPFRRGARQRSAVEGLGLGLFIVRAIAAAHGGEALVRSAEGRGTTFTVRLPR
jgi:PAS domain S-box-containing protein